MLRALAVLAMALTIGASADVTGRWQGTLTAQRDDGTTREDSALLILEQKGNEITGTIGGSDTDRHPITKGTIDGAKVTIQARTANGEREFLLELTLNGDEMKGTITSGERKGQVALKRSK
jgi:phosphosulfolactate phosphohydrolase-like enzyme